MNRRAAVAFIVLAVLVALPLPVARADRLAHRDESLDGFMFLDIAEIAHGHDGRLLTHRLTTHEAWTVEDLDNASRILFRFSTDPDGAVEREVRVDSGNGELWAVMFSGAGKSLGSVEVDRPNNRSVRIRFLPSMLKEGLERYRWRTKTNAQGCDNPDTETDPIAASKRCMDYAPNAEGELRHRL